MSEKKAKVRLSIKTTDGTWGHITLDAMVSEEIANRCIASIEPPVIFVEDWLEETEAKE